MLNIEKIRADFPILSRTVHGKPLVYLDSAATAQKPRAVLDAWLRYASQLNANVHRGVYLMSEEMSDVYEQVRSKVVRFIGGGKENEIVFTSGTTDSLNLVMQCWGEENVGEGDDIVVTRMEHHANFVGWQQLAQRKKANFKIIELTPDYRIDWKSFESAISGRPKVVAMTLMSNVLGVVNPIAELAQAAKAKGAIVVVDAAQAVAHLPMELTRLGPIDFLAFSGHKICAPTGTGVLWMREEIARKIRPYRYGGDMVRRVKDFETEWADIPIRFEAGTPNYLGIAAMGDAIDYLLGLGMKNIHDYEEKLSAYLLQKLTPIEGLTWVGPGKVGEQSSVHSFIFDGVHPHDVATFLDLDGVAVRAGHHCAHPLMKIVDHKAVTRASLTFFNTEQEVDLLADGLRRARKYFGRGRATGAMK